MIEAEGMLSPQTGTMNLKKVESEKCMFGVGPALSSVADKTQTQEFVGASDVGVQFASVPVNLQLAAKTLASNAAVGMV